MQPPDDLDSERGTVVTAADASRIALAISAAAAHSPNERVFQRSCTNVLAEYAQGAGVRVAPREEYILVSGRADAVYNRLVIEYEAPRSLSRFVTQARTSHAIAQAQAYIDQLVATEHHERERMLGVVLDGTVIVFVRFAEGAWSLESADWDEDSARRLLRSVISLSAGRALIPNNLVDDFGFDGELTASAIRALYEALDTTHPLVTAIFDQWKLLFSEVSNVASVKESSSLSRLSVVLGASRMDVPKLLFAIHTYFCFVAKLIARLVLERYSRRSILLLTLAETATLENDKLRAELESLEDGGAYGRLGFTNLLEADFFGWYLQVWSSPLASALRQVIARLADYNPSTLEEDPFAARDLLKKLYHYLMPREIRHNLGEYYTPDWLATRTIAMLGEDALLQDGTGSASGFSRRILDPACGSGTFLILAIRILRDAARRRRISPQQTLDELLTSVVGVDLNPLAVLAARVGYVLAIADLLPQRVEPVHIPVYLADSIAMPKPAGLFGQGPVVRTVVGSFAIPRGIHSVQGIAALTDQLEAAVREGRSEDAVLPDLMAEFGFERDSADAEAVLALFRRLRELHAERRDGIWARIIRNAVMPLFLGQFDIIVGNPPWIGWESVAETYRQQTLPLLEEYGLIRGRRGKAKLGAVKVDMSALMTLVVADRFLRTGGKLAFLITQSVFKTEAASGFRRFSVPSGELRVLYVDDMSELQPFEGASNRTAVLLIQKGAATKYPIVYTHWRKAVRGRGLGYDSTLPQVESMTSRLHLSAEPVNTRDATSKWLTARPRAIAPLRKLLAASDYTAHAGVCTWANGIYWLREMSRHGGLVRARNATDEGKRTVPEVEAELESESLFPLVRAADISRWEVRSELLHLIPHDPNNPARPRTPEDLRVAAPRTYEYLKLFEATLRARSGYKQLFESRGLPFYTVMDIDAYTFGKFKIVWPNISADIEAAVIPRDLVPQHTVTLVSVDDEAEAHYVCGLVNSTPFRYAAIAYSQAGGKSFGSPHLLENVRVPRYVGHAAHAEVATIARASFRGTRGTSAQELDECAARVWGLTPAELKELQAGFSEMRKAPRS